MDSDSPCGVLANAIQHELCRGISIGSDVIHYTTSVLGTTSLASLREILLDESSCEGTSLFELILFPDEGFQAAVEKILERYHFIPADEKSVMDILIPRKLETTLSFPGLGDITVMIPPEAVRTMVSRLNITYSTDPRIMASLDRFSQGAIRTRCLIRLRNIKWIQTESHIRFLQEVIEKQIVKSADPLESLDAVLEFLSDPHPESDIRQALLSEKERLVHLLDMADRQELLLRNSPMEAIMLQGTRILSIDRDKIIKQIHLLDRVCRY